MSKQVSIVTPTYNRDTVLRRAIDSILDQTYEDIECIVVDDGSTDDTRRVVESYDDEHVQYIYQENEGANAARNRGIKAATGEFISFLDSDDELHRQHLERCLNALIGSDDEVAGVYTSFFRIAPDGTRRVSRAQERVTFSDIVSENVIGTFSCTTFRKDALYDVGLLDEELQASQDYDLYIRLLKEYDMVGIDDVLTTCYTQDDSISGDFRKKTQGFSRLREKHGDILTSTRRARQLFSEGVLHAKAGEMEAAALKFRTADRVHPTPLYWFFYGMARAGRWPFSMSYWLATQARQYLSWLQSKHACLDNSR